MIRFVLVVCAILALSLSARADVRVSAGPVELAERGDRFSGAFTVENTGDAPLTISRIAVRDDDGTRAPRGLSVQPAQLELEPHQARTINVEWKPDPRGPSQVFSHVVVTSSDERAGEVAIGVHAQQPGPLGPLEGRVLSLALAVPLLGALALLAIALAFPHGQRRATRAIALGASFGQLAVVALALRRFQPTLSSAFGNEGLQLVERATWIRSLGVEWYIGLDGHAALALLGVALLGALSALADEKPEEGGAGLRLFTLAAASCAIVARDLALFVFALGCACVGGAMLVRARRGPMAFFMLAGLTAVVLCAIALRSGSGRAFLGDGTAVAHTWAAPELERVAFARATLLGLPLAPIAVVLALVGFGAIAGMLPLHPWMPATADSPEAVTAVVILPRLGAIGLVRVLAQIVPEGARWASASILALGALTLIHAGACALAETDWGKLGARFSMATTGLVLVGLGSGTPQGLAGASSAILTGSLASALVLHAGELTRARTGDRDSAKLAGLAAEAPLFSLVVVVGLLGCAWLPLTAGFWSALLALLGALPASPALAALAALGLLLCACAALRAVARVFFGEVPSDLRKLAALEPFGGVFPDLRQPEGLTLGLLALALVLLGAWPAPALDLLAGSLRDAIARANLGPLQLGW